MHLECEPKTSANQKTLKQDPRLHTSEPECVGFAVVGLGDECLSTILPAFEWCENARLTALVSGHPERAWRVAREHAIPAHSVYSFHDFDRIKYNRGVQVVYISLRGARRDSMIVRAARAGKHVICEGRFSGDTKIDRQVAQACDEAGVQLMMTYQTSDLIDKLAVLKLDHMASCVLRHQAPPRLSEVLRGLAPVHVDVSRWAN